MRENVRQDLCPTLDPSKREWTRHAIPFGKSTSLIESSLGFDLRGMILKPGPWPLTGGDGGEDLSCSVMRSTGDRLRGVAAGLSLSLLDLSISSPSSLCGGCDPSACSAEGGSVLPLPTSRGRGAESLGRSCKSPCWRESIGSERLAGEDGLGVSVGLDCIKLKRGA